MPGHSYTIYIDSENPKDDDWDYIDRLQLDIEKELKGHGYEVQLTYRGVWGC